MYISVPRKKALQLYTYLDGALKWIGLYLDRCEKLEAQVSFKQLISNLSLGFASKSRKGDTLSVQFLPEVS